MGTAPLPEGMAGMTACDGFADQDPVTYPVTDPVTPVTNPVTPE